MVLRRIKVRSHDGKGGRVAAGECRNDDHRAGTEGTTEDSRLGRSGVRYCGNVRLGVIQQQEPALRKQSRSTAVGQESERANADKAAGQNVQ